VNERILTLAGGRRLCVGTYGDEGGRPVVAFHGTPGSHRMWGTGNAAGRALGYRLIGADRPGYGGSDRQEGRTVATSLDDVAAIAEAFELDRFALLGVSGGTPFACAAAARYGDRVTALALVSPLAPVAEPDMRGHLNFRDRMMFLHAPRYPRALKAACVPAAKLFSKFPGPMFQVVKWTSAKADRRRFEHPEAAGMVADGIAALADGVNGGLADLAIYGRPWGVDFTRITAPARLWIGTADTIVPVGAAIALGGRIAGCAITELPGEGHFWIFGAMDIVLDGIAKLERIAAEQVAPLA
jgi:pimeloyl-ACP methyl ester carboxylesterase